MAGRTRRTLNTMGHGLFWPAVLLALASFVVALAGLSATQRYCSAGQVDSASFRQGASLPVGIVCHRAFRWVWWILWGSFFAIIVAAVVGGSTAHPAWHLPVVGLIAIAATLCCVAANFSVNVVDAYGSGDIPGGQVSRAKTMLAGFCLLAISFIVLLFAIGAAVAVSDEDDRRKGGAGYERSYGEEGRAGGPRARAPPPAPAGTAVVA